MDKKHRKTTEAVKALVLLLDHLARAALGGRAALDRLLLLLQDQLDVARRALVGVDATVGAVRAAAHVRRAVGLRPRHLELVHIQTLQLYLSDEGKNEKEEERKKTKERRKKERKKEDKNGNRNSRIKPKRKRKSMSKFENANE